MARVRTKVGNVFVVKLGEAWNRYLQYLNEVVPVDEGAKRIYDEARRRCQRLPQPSQMEEVSKKYFQYVANDLTMLNSSVIRAFKTAYPIDANPDLSEVVTGEVEFYAHCVIRWGLEMGLWEKVGNVTDVGRVEEALFATPPQSPIPDIPPALERVRLELEKASRNWRVWRINDPDFTYVGELRGENRKAEIGGVMPPDAIIYRMRTGKYPGVYPDFE
jgi:hypothetical protein